MRLFPRTGSLLIDSMLAVVRVVLFTLAVCLVVAVSALLLRATLVVAEGYTGSRRAASLVALAVFALYVGVPSYLLATRTDLDEEAEDRRGSDSGREDGEGDDRGSDRDRDGDREGF